MKDLRFCLVLLVATGCGSANTYVEPPLPEVTVATPVQKSVTEYLEFSGMTQPVETVEIRSRVRGFLKERHFTEGSEVRQGQLLLVIDEEPYQLQLEAAESRLKEADAALKQAEASKTREVAQAQVDLSRSQVELAEQEQKRIRSLFAKNATAQSDMDKLAAELKSREAELASALASLTEAVATYDTKILLCRAQRESAAIAVRNAKLDLSYCRMAAPISGRISRSQVDVGNLIEATGTAVLATIVGMNPVYAYATISETDLQRAPSLRPLVQTEGNTEPPLNLPVELGLANEPHYSRTGVIDYADPGIDQQTGTLRIRGEFLNEDHALLPGMFVRMRMPIGKRDDALLVPEQALGTDQSGSFLLVVDSEGKVEYCPVKTGVMVDSLRVVDGELAANDRVIVEGLLRARPGAMVQARMQAEASAKLKSQTLSSATTE